MMKVFVCGLLLAVCGWASSAFAQSAYEREQIRLMLAQLQNMQAIAAQMEHNATVLETDRYRFDYDRLNKDLKAVRTGLEHYLTPSRAQPREVVDAPVAGNYQKDRSAKRGNE
jgi:RAQPRD family integrative conjugative element protein